MEIPLEVNELNQNAMGGTELMAHRLRQHVDSELLDKFQIIQSRSRELDPDKKKIYWLHDLPGDPEVQHLKDGGWKKYDKLVFVSHWQQSMYKAYLGVPYEAGIVLRNAIEPIEAIEKPTDKLRFIYFSTPHRGLDILYAAFDGLSKQYSNVELNVFSSFDLYGWPQRDEPYQDLFKQLEDHEHINYHKSVSNDRIREELQKAHVFAYPSNWQETSCLCLIEAMSAGLVCVHSSLAALPETAMNMTQMYDYTEDKKDHANRFHANLASIVETLGDESKIQNVNNGIGVMKQFTDSLYNWKTRGDQWTFLLNSLIMD